MKKIKNKFLHFHRLPLSDKLTYILFFIFFLFMALVFIFPIYSSILLSFTKVENIKMDDVNSIWDFFKINGDPQIKSWANVINYFSIVTTNGNEANLLTMIWNSLWFTVVKVSVGIIASTILAYAVCKFEFPGKKLLYLTAVFVQTIPLFGSGATSYKIFDALGMVNNPWLFWIAWCSGFNFTFIIMHGVFSGINDSYSESAKIDGASNLTILVKIILPMIVPTLVALFVSNSLTVWNDYSTIMIYLTDYPTLGYGLYMFQNGAAQYAPNSEAVKSAAMIVSMLPIAIIYACSQKLILSNITVGGLKG